MAVTTLRQYIRCVRNDEKNFLAMMQFEVYGLLVYDFFEFLSYNIKSSYGNKVGMFQLIWERF